MNSLMLEPDKQARPVSPQLNETDRPARILVAEDNGAIREFCAEFLTRSGYEVTAVENGAAAWEELQWEHYDLLITDNDMPEMTGIELIQKMRSQGMQLPTIVASGSLSSIQHTHGALLESAYLLPKPFSLHDLTGLIKKLVTTAPAPRG